MWIPKGITVIRKWCLFEAQRLLEEIRYLSFYQFFIFKQVYVCWYLIGVQRLANFLTHSYHHIYSIYLTVKSHYKKINSMSVHANYTTKVRTQRKSLIYITSIKLRFVYLIDNLRLTFTPK